MPDILSFVSLNIVSQIFPTLIVDIFKYLSKKKSPDFRNRRFS